MHLGETLTYQILEKSPEVHILLFCLTALDRLGKLYNDGTLPSKLKSSCLRLESSVDLTSGSAVDPDISDMPGSDGKEGSIGLRDLSSVDACMLP